MRAQRAECVEKESSAELNDFMKEIGGGYFEIFASLI